MFTGLVQDIGSVESVEGGADGARLRIATKLGAEIGLGDSIAVNGVCLTATEADAAGFATEAMNQTLEVTVIGALAPGARVNLELATRADERLGGHIVQGHADGSGEVIEITEDGFARRVRVELPEDLLRYVVDKGSVALNGVSLTVAELGPTWVEVSLIPETLERTNLGSVAVGDPLNVEVDVIAKYVERLLSPFAGKDQSVSNETDITKQTDDAARDPRRRAGLRQPLRDDRGGDRRDPPRQDGRRLRRRRPRERGRPGDGGAVRDAGGGQLHGQGGARADLPGADPGALPQARPQPDGGEERGAAADRLHRLDRGGGRGQHRDLRPRPRPHDPGRDRPRLGPPRHRRPRPHVPAAGERGRRARAHRPHRGERRPGAARGPDPGGRDLRGDERRRLDGPRPRPRPLLREARAADDHGRRPDRLPAQDREAGRTGRGDGAADRLRRLPGGRLPLAGRRQTPRRDGQRRGRRGRGRARPRPQRVPHRRRLPQHALRLRRAARGLAVDDRGARAAASSSTCPRRDGGSAC